MEMGNDKVVFKFFTIAQYQQEEEYLSSMHEKGWKLKKIIFPWFYHFEKCEPKKVTYRLDYNQEGIKNKAEYVQMFSDCGWDYLFDFVGYSYFCKKTETGQESEEIFCDDSSKLDMMKRVYRGRIVPLITIFMGVILPQLFINTAEHGGGDTLKNVISYIFLILAILYLSLFSVMTYQFYQCEKRLSPENPTVIYKYFSISILILLMVICIGTFFCLCKFPI